MGRSRTHIWFIAPAIILMIVILIVPVFVLAAALSGTLAASAAMAENVTIEVGYPYSALFDVTFERIMPLFKEAHPDIDVKFRATYDNYEDGTNTVLRESVADKLPDITLR